MPDYVYVTIYLGSCLSMKHLKSAAWCTYHLRVRVGPDLEYITEGAPAG